MYSPLGNTFKKETKTIEDQGRKQTETLQPINTDQQLKWIKDLFLKNLSNTEAKDDIEKNKMTEQKIVRDDLNKMAQQNIIRDDLQNRQ